jgi:hypothetical protein
VNVNMAKDQKGDQRMSMRMIGNERRPIRRRTKSKYEKKVSAKENENLNVQNSPIASRSSTTDSDNGRIRNCRTRDRKGFCG